MQVVSFYGLLDDYQIPGMSKNKSGISRVLVRTIMYHMSIRSTVVLAKMSGHYSRYRDNYEGQVDHALC